MNWLQKIAQPNTEFLTDTAFIIIDDQILIGKFHAQILSNLFGKITQDEANMLSFLFPRGRVDHGFGHSEIILSPDLKNLSENIRINIRNKLNVKGPTKWNFNNDDFYIAPKLVQEHFANPKIKELSQDAKNVLLRYAPDIANDPRIKREHTIQYLTQ